MWWWVGKGMVLALAKEWLVVGSSLDTVSRGLPLPHSLESTSHLQRVLQTKPQDNNSTLQSNQPPKALPRWKFWYSPQSRQTRVWLLPVLGVDPPSLKWGTK